MVQIAAGAMSMFARVSKNTSILIAAQIVEKVLNFLLVVVLVRYLTEETFGQYGFISSFVALFSVLVGLGFASLCT